MRDEFKPAIDALVTDLREQERAVARTKEMINRLCELAGAAPMYADASSSDRPAVTAMRSDQFYGKVQTTAAREYLELRHATNRGPASPREIFDALIEGGFKFDTKVEINAITGLRATLRKNSSIFHKLPNGDYGLTSWYPNAKAARFEGANEEVGKLAKTSKRGPGRPPKRPTKVSERAVASRRSKPRIRKEATQPIAPSILDMMGDEREWRTDRLRSEGIARAAPGFNGALSRSAIHGALLNLKNRGLVLLVGKGVWKIASKGTTPNTAIPDSVIDMPTAGIRKASAA